MQNKLVYSEDWALTRLVTQMIVKTFEQWSMVGIMDVDQVVPSIVRNVKWNRKEMREGRG